MERANAVCNRVAVLEDEEIPPKKCLSIAGLNYYPANGLIITPNVRITTPEEGEETTHAMLNFRFKF